MRARRGALTRFPLRTSYRWAVETPVPPLFSFGCCRTHCSTVTPSSFKAAPNNDLRDFRVLRILTVTKGSVTLCNVEYASTSLDCQAFRVFHVKNAERTFAVELGNRLKRARMSAGAAMEPPRQITQEEAGRIVGVTGVTVGAWESGRNEPPLFKLRKLSELYGVHFEWLAIGTGTMWGAPAAKPPRYLGEDPLDDGVDSEAAIDAREAGQRPPGRAAEAGRPDRASGAGGRSSDAPPAATPPKHSRGARKR